MTIELLLWAPLLLLFYFALNTRLGWWAAYLAVVLLRERKGSR
jgi:hypothetical protein